MEKRIIILFVTALLFGWTTFLPNISMASGGGDSEAAEDVVRFVELDPLILPIVDNEGVSQTVNMIVALEVHSEEAAAKIDMYKPKIIDAFIQDLYGVLNEHAALKGGVIQLSIIKERLVVISNEILGEDTVQEVLLQVVSQRRL